MAAGPVVPAAAGSYVSIQNIDTQTEFPRIKILLSVNTKESDMSGLTDDNITVYEDGYRANWVSVKSLGESGDLLYLVFSVDSSKSISREFLKSIKSNAREILNSSSPGDRIAIYQFDDTVRLLSDFTERRKDLFSRIEAIERHGTKTMLFDSIYDSLELLEKVNSCKKKIIVFTDGKDEGSSINENDVVELARQKAIPLFFITIKTTDYLAPLSRMAKLTGGKVVYSSNHGDVAGMYRTVLSVIKSMYEVTYKTDDARDGKNHTIEVRLRHDNVRDRDSQSVVFYGEGGLRIPGMSDILFLALIGLLIVVVVITLVFYSKRQRQQLKETCESRYKIDDLRKRFDRIIEKDQKERTVQYSPIQEGDSEYTYASAWLVEKDGPDSGNKFPIYWDQITLGRSGENSIVVEDDSVSLNHARIKNVRKAYYLFDLVSENGTYLNGKKLLRPRPLYDWDEIRIGRVRFIFRGSRNGHKN